MLNVIVSPVASATIGGLHDVRAPEYHGEWSGPRTAATRAAVRVAVVRAVRAYGLSVRRAAVRWDGTLRVIGARC